MSSYTVIDTPDGVSRLISAISHLPTNPPSLYIDLEGVNLGRHGTISILQLHARPTRHTYLLDVHTLGAHSFTTPHADLTLKSLLESSSIPKVIFDVRNDSDALFSHFGISLAGIHDLQLMELATRTRARRYVCGLAKCIEYDAPMPYAQKAAWKATKQAGLRLFEPSVGGSYDVFNERPLRSEVLDYCLRDVEFLPGLWDVYEGKLRGMPLWRDRVRRETEERVALSQRGDYDGKSQSKALAPRGWEGL